MSEEVIVRLGAPTLAGIKTGSLFTCAYTSRKSVEESLRQLNRCFAPKGLCLLPLRYSEKNVLLYLFRPAEDMVELLYQSPEGRQILGIELDENGQPVCILSALPQLEEPDPTPAPEENGTDNTNSGTKSDESSGENPASNAKDGSSSLWDDEENSEKSELGDANAGEESAIPTEKVELDMTAASPEP